MLQDIVDESLAEVGGSLARAGCTDKSSLSRGRTPASPLAALSHKECERVAGVIKAAVANMFMKRN